jgi:hypothetical protein
MAGVVDGVVERVLATIVVAVVAASAIAQPAAGFLRAGDGTVWPAARQRIDYGPGHWLAVRDGRLLLTRNGVEAEMPCTLRDGPGTVRELTRHPCGTVFVAADNGLFLTDAEHDVLDPPPARDGMPPGQPIGIHADDRGRLWLATTTSFGVVDPRLFFGRTFGRADGLPEPPFTGLAAAGDRLLLRTAHGIFEYTPDRSPAPTGTVRGGPEIDGQPDGTVALDVEGTAAGGATFRYRRRNHHILDSLDPPVVTGLKPGRHVIEVLAFDRDLNASPVRTLTVRIPFPRAFDQRLLLPMAGLAGLAIVLLFGWRARRAGGGRDAYARALLSSGLLAVLGLQLLAGVLGYGRAWPFVGFSMYSGIYEEGSVLYKPLIVGIRGDGTRRIIAPWETGVFHDGYWQILSELVYGDDAQRQRFVDAFNGGHPADRIVGFEIHDQRTRLTASGPVPVAPIVMVRHARP